MANFMQRLVSKKKRRLQEDGFDLDMTFITPNIVAMGFPAEKIEAIYRNKMVDVKRYFDSKHGDHYKVYNLCSERDYDADKFYGRVAKFPFDDHSAPPFVLFKPFCEDVDAYLKADPRNVAVIHCKAGKGRTGVMICAYLLYSGRFTETADALRYYGETRTHNGKGVTIPSQIRYVYYFGRYLRERRVYQPTVALFKAIKLHGIPNIANGTCAPVVTIRVGPEKVLVHRSDVYDGITRDQGEALLPLSPPVPICGDVLVEFFHKTRTGVEKMFFTWFNPFFVENNVETVHKPLIDKANKDKKHKVYPEDFYVQFILEAPSFETRDMIARTQAAEEAVQRAAGDVLPSAAAFPPKAHSDDTAGAAAAATPVPSDDDGHAAAAAAAAASGIENGDHEADPSLL